MKQPKDSPKRKRLPSAERREEFIQQAIDFFAEEGFESSTRGLALKLGVTQPLLYRYFPSKDDLNGNRCYVIEAVRCWTG
jgi:AcrR family transcriptional regulator